MALSRRKQAKLERQRRERVVKKNERGVLDWWFTDHYLRVSIEHYLTTGEMLADFPDWCRERNATIK